MVNMTRYLEEELQEALYTLNLGNKAERNADIVTKYLGLDGLGGAKGGFSMEAVGKPHGLTREMVRQIKNKISSQAPGTSSHLPKLKKCGEILDSMLPCEARTVEAILAKEGLTREGFRIEGIVNALEMFGIKTSVFSMVEHKNGRFLISSEKQERWAAEILSKAGSLVSHNGAANISQLAKELTSKKDTKIKTESAYSFVKGVIACRDESDLVWLDGEESWFYFTNVARNRVITRVEKIFSVCKSCNVSQLIEGIDRSFSKDKEDEYVLLPETILIKLLEKTGNFSLAGSGVIESITSFDANEHLRDFEKLIVDAIRASETGIVNEGELEKQIIYKDGASEEEAKTNKYGFSVALNFSPLITKVKRGRYGLIGTL